MTQAVTETPARAAPNGAAGPLFATSRDGTRIAYTTAGSGPYLIHVTGALGTRDNAWTKAMSQELQNHFTVVDYNRRGRGESGDTPPYSPQKEIEDLAALVKAVGGKAHVFGLSSGAALALEAAAAGVPMERLIAFEPPYYVGPAKNRAPPPDYREHVTRLIADGRRDDAVKYFMGVVGVPGPMVAVMRLFPMWKGLRAAAHTLPYDAAVMGDFTFPKTRFAGIGVPTLAVSGEKSPDSLRNSVALLAKTVPNATHRTLPKQNHGVKPEAIVPVIAEWVARPIPRGGGR